MGKHRRSIAGGGSVRNKGDQPLSPPTTPIPPKRTSHSTQNAGALYNLPSPTHSYYEGSDPAMLQHMLTTNLEADIPQYDAMWTQQQEAEDVFDEVSLKESVKDDASSPVSAVTPPSPTATPTTMSQQKEQSFDEEKEQPRLESANSLSEEISQLDGVLSASLRRISASEQQQARASLVAVGATLALLLLQLERLGLRTEQMLLPSLKWFALVLATVPPVCFAYMCWLRLPPAATDAAKDLSNSESSVDDVLSKSLSGKALERVQRAEVLQRFYGRLVLKALACFAVFEFIRVYSFLWPFLHIPQLQTDYILREGNEITLPPVFAAAQPGVRIGFHGFPPRPSALAASTNDFGRSSENQSAILLLQLILPLLGGVFRFLGLRYCSKAFQEARVEETEISKGMKVARFAAKIMGMVCVGFVAMSLARAIFGRHCSQPYTGLFPLVGEAATEYASVVLLVNSICSAVGAAVARSMLVAAASVVGQKASRRTSQILGLAAAAFLSVSLGLEAIAVVQQQGPECQYIHFISDMLNGDVMPKLMVGLAAAFGGVGLLFLSCSVAAFGFRNRLIFKTLEGIPIDEETDIYVKDRE